MFRFPRNIILLALICGILFVVGMVQLFLLRFEAGDIYPAYSSLRSDPLGSQALFESLQRIAPDSVHRNFRPLQQAEMDGHTTLMLIGIGKRGFIWARPQYDQLLEKLAQSGGRLVLTFTPSPKSAPADEQDSEQPASDADEKKTTSDEGEAEEGTADGETADCQPCDNTDNIVGAGLNALGFDFNDIVGTEWEDFADRFYGAGNFLPETLPWRSPLSFNLIDNSWETLYTWQGQPVVVQRPWGDGKVVMVADSYLLSNEALRNHRYPELLAWLVKPGNRIVFDESLKGLLNQPGMAGLARQYRLYGVFAAVLVVVVLFVWRQSVIFITPVRELKSATHTAPAAGGDTSQGLVHLARQHIDAGALLPICLQAWKTQAARNVSASRIAQVEAIVAAAAADTRNEKQVKTYIEICELLRQGRRS